MSVGLRKICLLKKKGAVHKLTETVYRIAGKKSGKILSADSEYAS
jgi:hypothetical protein